MEKTTDIALIELYDFHSECLYSQVAFLKDKGYKVHVLCNSKLKKNIEEFREADHINFFRIENGFFIRLLYNNLTYRNIRKYLIKNHICHVVINTGSGKFVKKLFSIHFPRHIHFTGIIHDTNYFTDRDKNRIISKKVKKYILLAEHLKEGLIVPNDLKISICYLIFLRPWQQNPISNKDDELWVAVPGNIHIHRRDYESILNIVSTENINKKIRFILLGSIRHHEGKIIQQKIEKMGISDYFVTFNDYIDHHTFHSWLERCDLIMPLIHWEKPSLKLYYYRKITGSFNLSYFHKIPMLSENYFEKINEIKSASFLYSPDNLSGLLNHLFSDREAIKKKSEEIKMNPKYSFKYQQEQYIKAILD